MSDLAQRVATTHRMTTTRNYGKACVCRKWVAAPLVTGDLPAFQQFARHVAEVTERKVLERLHRKVGSARATDLTAWDNHDVRYGASDAYDTVLRIIEKEAGVAREIPPDEEVAGQAVEVWRDGEYRQARLLRKFRNGWRRVHLIEEDVEMSVESWQVREGGSDGT